jgi:hypothetical protein
LVGEKEKNMRQYFKLCLLGLGFALLAMAVLKSNSPVKADDGGSIIGTWINTVTVNTPPGAPPFVITELGSFNPGGTFIDTLSIAHSSQNPFLAGPFAPLAADFSDAYGIWRQSGDNSDQFAITFKRLIFAGADTPTAAYGTFFPGENVGFASIQAVATLQHGQNGDTLTGPFTFQLTNLSGRVVLAASGSFSATRVKIEPLATP